MHEQYIERRRKERLQEPIVEFIDGQGFGFSIFFL